VVVVVVAVVVAVGVAVRLLNGSNVGFAAVVCGATVAVVPVVLGFTTAGAVDDAVAESVGSGWVSAVESFGATPTVAVSFVLVLALALVLDRPRRHSTRKSSRAHSRRASAHGKSRATGRV